MVPDANTVVYPRAMVIEALDAMTADATVPASASSNCLTVWTEVGAANDVKHIHKLNFFVFDVSWLFTGGQCEE